MKYCEVKDNAYSHTSNSSSANRTIIIAGLAAAWLFVNKENNAISLSTTNSYVVSALFFFSISICFDILQYFFSSVIWYFHVLLKLDMWLENKSSHNQKKQDEFAKKAIINIDSKLNMPNQLLFISKNVAGGIGGYLLALGVIDQEKHFSNYIVNSICSRYIMYGFIILLVLEAVRIILSYGNLFGILNFIKFCFKGDKYKPESQSFDAFGVVIENENELK